MRILGLFPLSLTSVCVRFAVGMPPVWLRVSTANQYGVNHFGFDYPLGCSWFLCVYSGVLLLLDLRSASGRCREMPRSRPAFLSGVGECSRSFKDVAFGG